MQAKLIQHDDRRASPRINAQWLLATVSKRKGLSRKREPVRVLDLSDTGIGILVRDPELAPGSNVSITLHYSAHFRKGVQIDENRLESIVRNAVSTDGVVRCGIEFVGAKTLKAVANVMHQATVATTETVV